MTAQDPANGDMLLRPWYCGEDGLRHAIVLCLRCGAIYDAVGSIRSALFSLGKRPYKAVQTFSPVEFSDMILKACPDPARSRSFAIDELAIPPEVVDVMVERKILGDAFAKLA